MSKTSVSEFPKNLPYSPFFLNFLEIETCGILRIPIIPEFQNSYYSRIPIIPEFQNSRIPNIPEFH